MEKEELKNYLGETDRLRDERITLLKLLRDSQIEFTKKWYEDFMSTSNKVMINIEKEKSIWEILGDYVVNDEEEETGIPIIDNILSVTREAAIDEVKNKLDKLNSDSDDILLFMGHVISEFRTIKEHFSGLSPFTIFLLNAKGIDTTILDLELPKKIEEKGT